jgi:16S rRNA (uracil1498-N3)-methyltransferase
MAPRHRFYTNPIDRNAQLVILEGNEAHHAIHVLRVASGETVELFDGQGHLFRGYVSSISKKSMEIELGDHTLTPMQSPSVTLTQSWLNHEKNHETIIRRATELGVSEIRFIKTKNSERKPKANSKWTRWAVESCKQCKRVWLPKIGIVEAGAGEFPGNVNLIATQHAEHTALSDIEFTDTPINIHIGPEGDFSRDEVQDYLSLGAIPIGLGSATYRSEIAAQVAVTLVQYRLGKMGSL